MITKARAVLYSLGLISSLVLVACATGPKYSEMKASIRDLEPGAGRIYFYRTSVYGAAYSAEIKLNGTPVGSAVSKGFFYVDRKPGSYQVAVGSQVNAINLTLNAGQTLYVRTSIAGFFPVLNWVASIIDDTTAKGEINDLSYVGGDLSPPGAK